jgi:hypothetical protein
MYVNQQRKKLKPCLSFQRHDSKIHKQNLRKFKFRKHIRKLYQLLSNILPVSYKMATLQEHIVQAILATPPQAPISFNPSDLYIDPFPDHIFPQLRSLKRSIGKAKKSKQMDPVHWQSGIRPNRPFEQIFQNPQYSHFTPPRLRSQPLPRPAVRPRQIPTQYYLEQAPFYAENFGPDPFATEPEVITPGSVKAIVLFFLAIFPRISIPCLGILDTLVFGVLALGRFVVFWVIWRPVKLVCEVVGSVEWEVLVAMAIANQIVKFLPGMGEEMLTNGGEGDGPVYTIFIKGGRAIGSGPVMAESC